MDQIHNTSEALEKKLTKVVVGISGGVDSAVSAYLLKAAGYDVTGVFMQCWDARADGCRVEEDKKYAVETAANLGIKFEHLDYRAQYKDKVISYFYDEYSKGRTPNPDIMCNKEIKFGLFYDWAIEQGFDYVATGHYARVDKDSDGSFNLLRGTDETKDQSYFLYILNNEHLAHTMFPVGGMKKTEVRKLAQELKLPPAARPDSVGICFIGEVDIKEFLKKQLDMKVGKVLSLDGDVIGEHDGAWFYTVGQRHGFRINKYFGVPLYVVSKNVDKNEIVVSTEENCYRSEFEVTNLHWLNKEPSFKDGSFFCDVRIRHLGKIMSAELKLNNEPNLDYSSNTGLPLKVILEKPIFAVAPGQSVVFYTGETVLGGGIIA